MRIDDDDFTMTWEMIKFMFFDTHNLALWAIPLGLAVLLRVITHKYHHQLIFPLCECFLLFVLVAYIFNDTDMDEHKNKTKCRFHHHSGPVLYHSGSRPVGSGRPEKRRVGVRYGC